MQKVLSKMPLESPHLVAVLKALQNQSIDYAGPFLTSNGRIVFRVENKIVLDWELMALFGTGKLNRAGIATLLNRLH